MKNVELAIEETLKYNRGMAIEIPDDMTEEKLNKILDQVQFKAQAVGDISLLLEDFGIKIIEYPDESLSSPWDTELEIVDFNIQD